MTTPTKFSFIPILALALGSSVTAQKPTKPRPEPVKKILATDPAEAGPDFAVQGEYARAAKARGKKGTGAQVIALGQGKFQLVLHAGGLPGAGWKKGDKREKADGETIDGLTTFKTAAWTATIKNGKLTLTGADGESPKPLKRTERKSPTLGAQPPVGALVLFDGSSAEHFDGGRLTKDKHLMAGSSTNKTMKNYSLHLEFRTPFKPDARGQGRGNSGVYVQGIYECQVLDSFGLEGKNNECGGIYSIREPAVNMCYPPLSWQTYDIDFTSGTVKDGKKINPRMTVRHNGVLIHDDVELPKTTRGGKKEGFLYLQGHGNPVVYRNIWMMEKN